MKDMYEMLEEAMHNNIKGVVTINGLNLDVVLTHHLYDGLYQEVQFASVGHPRFVEDNPKQSIRQILVEAHKRIQEEHKVALTSVSFPHMVQDMLGKRYVTEVEFEGEVV